MRFLNASARRRRKRRTWPRLRFGRRAVAAGAMTLLLSAVGWLWLDGWYGRQVMALGDSLAVLGARAGLRVEEVFAEGRRRTPAADLLARLELARGVPLLAFDPHAAKARLETLPWVRTATIERRLPDTVYVRLIERRPLALWQHEGRVSLLDDLGQVIPGARPEAFAALPLLVGADAPRHAAALLAMLDGEPILRSRVAAAVRVQGRRWSIRLDDGIDVHLPETDAAAAWAALARLQREQAVLQRDVAAIDLRFPDRLVVRSAPGAAPVSGSRRAGEDA